MKTHSNDNNRKTYEFGARVDKSDEKQIRRMQIPFVYRMDVDLAIAQSGVIADAKSTPIFHFIKP